MNTIKLLILLPFFMATNNSLNTTENQGSAKSYIKLYTEHVGGTAWNWIAENTSSDRAIKFTIRYSQGGAIVNRWSKTFTLEPGDFKHVGRYRDQYTTTISAYVKGARYIRN